MKNLSFVKVEISTFSASAKGKYTNFDETNRNEIDLLNKSIREEFIFVHFLWENLLLFPNAEDITQ